MKHSYEELLELVVRDIPITKYEDANNYSRAGRESYFANKENFKLKPFPEELIFATINTCDNIDSQIDEVIDKLSKFIN